MTKLELIISGTFESFAEKLFKHQSFKAPKNLISVNRHMFYEADGLFNTMKLVIDKKIKEVMGDNYNTHKIYDPADAMFKNAVDSVTKRFSESSSDYQGIIELRVDFDGNEFTFEVEDNGAGIDPNIEDLLYEDVILSPKRGHLEYCGGHGTDLTMLKNKVDKLNGKKYHKNKGRNKGAIFGYSVPINSKKIKSVDQLEVFNQYFPKGKISEITLDEIPDLAMKRFESRSAFGMNDKESVPGNFSRLFMIEHDDGTHTYVASQNKAYNNRREGIVIDDFTYLVDMVGEDKVGTSTIRQGLSSEDSFFVDKPGVSWTETEKGHYKEGLGTRRLHMMNALSQAFYDNPLHSATLIKPKAESLWKHLVEEGEATSFIERNDRVRYVFN